MVGHLPGERRRALVVASVVTLALYLAMTALAHWLAGIGPGTLAADYLKGSAATQGIGLAVVWLGVGLWALAQAPLIAYRQGAYGIVASLTDTRAMRGLGLGFGALVIAVLAIAAAANVLADRLLVVGVLTAIALLALGLPDAPARRYEPPA